MSNYCRHFDTKFLRSEKSLNSHIKFGDITFLGQFDMKLIKQFWLKH